MGFLFERKEKYAKSEFARKIKSKAHADRIRDSQDMNSPTITIGSVTLINPLYEGPNPYCGPEAFDPQNVGRLFIPIRAPPSESASPTTTTTHSLPTTPATAMFPDSPTSPVTPLSPTESCNKPLPCRPSALRRLSRPPVILELPTKVNALRRQSRIQIKKPTKDTKAEERKDTTAEDAIAPTKSETTIKPDTNKLPRPSWTSWWKHTSESIVTSISFNHTRSRTRNPREKLNPRDSRYTSSDSSWSSHDNSMDSREPHPSGWGEIREPSSWRDTGHWRDSRDWSDTREWRDASEELELLESIHMVNAMKRPSYCFSQAMTASAVEFVEFIDNDPFAKAPLEHPLRQARSFSN